MDLKEINQYVEEVIREFLPSEEGCPSDLAKAMNYAMTAGGKRIRPTLMYLSYRAIIDGEKEDKAEIISEGTAGDKVIKPFMAAIEMIHTHSLIHDDLPALDNDNLRRGRPTVHVEFSESTAILAGDALLNYAYETACKGAEVKENLSCFSDALKVLLSKTGINGMLGGQGLDVQLSGSRISDEERDYIYKNKTCALIEAPMMIGGILAGAEASVIEKLEEAGECIGMAFQVQDDILDVIGDAEKLGKEVNQDARNEKNTFALAYGVEEASRYVREKSENAIKILESILPANQAADRLIELINSMIGRDI